MKGRLVELDALRGIAAVSVVLFHYFWVYHEKYQHNFEPWAVFEYGFLGVHLFFILSGFVIFWTLNRSANLADFLVSRASRLYPVFWVSAMITFLFVSIAGPENRQVSVESFLINLTMFHEYIGYPHVDGVYWTLSIELAFYILAAIAMCLGLLRWANYICVVWISGGLIAYGVGVDNVPDLIRKVFVLKYCHLFAAGILFYLVRQGDRSLVSFSALALSLLVNWLCYSPDVALIITAIYVAFGLALAGRLNWLSARPLVYLGSISYSLYLIHQNIGYGIMQAAYAQGVSPILSIGLAGLLSLALAHVLTRYVEQPALSLIRQRWRARSQPVEPRAMETQPVPLVIQSLGHGTTLGSEAERRRHSDQFGVRASDV